MNKTLTISVIALVAVVMGMSAVAPVIPYVDAHGGGTPTEACIGLQKIPNPSPVIEHLISHCCTPPECDTGDEGREGSKTI